MTLAQIIEAVDALPPAEYMLFLKHLEEHKRTGYWLVPSENLAKINEIFADVQAEAAQMTDEEINASIDEAIAEVRGGAANRRR